MLSRDRDNTGAELQTARSRIAELEAQLGRVAGRDALISSLMTLPAFRAGLRHGQSADSLLAQAAMALEGARLEGGGRVQISDGSEGEPGQVRRRSAQTSRSSPLSRRPLRNVTQASTPNRSSI